MENTTKKDRDGNIQKPTSMISHNHNMGKVDLVDQQLDALPVLKNLTSGIRSYS